MRERPGFLSCRTNVSLVCTHMSTRCPDVIRYCNRAGKASKHHLLGNESCGGYSECLTATDYEHQQASISKQILT